MDAEIGPAVVCIGGSETFGRFIHAPFPTQLGTALGKRVLNLGVVNAGLDVMINDPSIEATVNEAEAVVLQITSAHNMTNRFYTVHPRRNDRFVTASAMLRTIYPQVDFTEFHFTRHMLTHLRAASEDRFEIVRTELEAAWVARMRRFISGIAAPVHLLWLSNRSPDAPEDTGLLQDPLFVTRRMLEQVEGDAASLTIIAPETANHEASVRGMFFGPKEEEAARLLPGPDMHERAAAELQQLLR
jgi:hypothetical protein